MWFPTGRVGPVQQYAHARPVVLSGSAPQVRVAMSFLSRTRGRSGACYHPEAARFAGLGRHDKALKSLNRAIELAPAQAAWHYRRAAELARLGRPAEALADFDRVAALMPGQTDADYQRAIQLSRLARNTEALEALDEFLSCLPPNPDALILRRAELVELGHRAKTLPRLGRHEEALAAHDRAVASAPEQIYFRIQKRKATTAARPRQGSRMRRCMPLATGGTPGSQQLPEGTAAAQARSRKSPPGLPT